MSLSGSELEAMAAELARLEGGQAQKISVVLPDTAVFQIRIRGESALVQFKVDEACARVSVVGKRPEAPAQAASLQGLFRSRLDGARLSRVQPDGAKRLLILEFMTHEEKWRLCFEIQRLGATLSLVNAENRILGVLKAGSQARPLRPGGTWTMPDAQPDASPQSRFTRPPPDTPWPVSALINRVYDTAAEERADALIRRRVGTTLRKRLKRVRHTLAKIQTDRARMNRAEEHRRYGDLLKPTLHTIAKGASEAVVTEWTSEGARDVVVPLLPELSAKANMERHYHQHKRLSRSVALVDERLAEFEQTEAELVRALQELEHLSSAELAVYDEHGSAQTSGQTKGKPEPRLPYREYRSASGRRIWVGRGARDNDALTFRHARGNDLWLHARGVPGSHVIIPGCGAASPDEQTLLDAATLAAHFSASRGERVVDVATTERKHLQKPKGAAPGSVRYTQERALSLRLEPERLARLLATDPSRSTSS